MTQFAIPAFPRSAALQNCDQRRPMGGRSPPRLLSVLHEPLTVLDLEATGLHPEAGDRLTEIGLVRIENGRIAARWQSLVNCGKRLTASTIAYTGITQAMIDAAPEPRAVLERAFDFIGDTPVVSHGAGFDQSLLRFECERAGVDRRPAPFLCSLRLSRRVYGHLREHSLAALAHSLQLGSTAGAHRASHDAEITAKLVLRLSRDLAAEQRGADRLSARELRRLLHIPSPAFAPAEAALCA